MSRQLVSHSPDLARLQDEGYDIRVDEGNLLHVHVPYVKQDRSIGYGHLVAGLTIEIDPATGEERAGTPNTHVANFVGESPDDKPCNNAGLPLTELMNQETPIDLGGGVVASCSFSHKPDPTYRDHYEQMTTYADMLLSEVHQIDPNVRVQTFPPIELDEDESVFRYRDSATSRARIGAVTDRIRNQKVVVVGVGGTGSYVLDALAKAPLREIHLYDNDIMLTHNAFRSPGAASLDELRTQPLKVDLHQRTYDAMHRRVIAHAEYVDEANISELRDADFVFLCMDAGPAKRFIIDKLQEFGVPLVDTGMGISQVGYSLEGVLRTTKIADGQENFEAIRDELSFADEDANEYEQNIQIAELNMLNAALAVIMWKKHFGFYADLEGETSSYYTIDGNHLANEGLSRED